MFLKAKYLDGKDTPCMINTDFVVDVFPENGKYTLYVFDNERCGYSVTKKDFERFLEWEDEE